MKAPTIETERLVLRSFDVEDIPAFARIMQDKETMGDLYAISNAPQDPHGFSAWWVGDAIKSWQRSGFGNWAVSLRKTQNQSDHSVIGFAGFLSESLLLENPLEVLEVGWGFDPAVSGQGLATEAASAILKYGFEVLEIDKIMAITSRDNGSSRRLMERLAMRLSDDAAPYGYDDCLLFTLLKKEWTALKRRP